MRRRTFLAGLGFAALQLAGCAAKPQTTPDYVLTYADNQPAGYPTTQGAQYFADLVQQQTGGKVVIQVKANGEYGSEQQVWEQLAIGGVDFARVSLSVATDDLPRLKVLLFMMHDAQKCRAVGDKPRGLPAYCPPNHTKNRRANQVNQTANRWNHKQNTNCAHERRQ